MKYKKYNRALKNQRIVFLVLLVFKLHQAGCCLEHVSPGRGAQRRPHPVSPLLLIGKQEKQEIHSVNISDVTALIDKLLSGN